MGEKWKYQHIERLGVPEVEGILNGKVYIFTKLDGSCGTVFYEDGKVKCASRKRLLSIKNDNAGFYRYVIEQERFKLFFEKYPDCILFGEWLVKHRVKTYVKDAWNRFYVFDVMKDGKYLTYEEYQPMLEEFNIEYIPVAVVLQTPTDEEIKEHVDKYNFLQPQGSKPEGIVIKRYDFVNQYGETVWAKLISDEFKKIKLGGNKNKETSTAYDYILDKYCTEAFIEKEYQKFVEINGWRKRDIPKFLEYVWETLLKEEAFHIVVDKDAPHSIDFRPLRLAVVAKIKEVKQDVFS